MCQQEEWQPEDRQAGKAFVDDLSVDIHPELLENGTVGRIIVAFVLFNEFIVKIMVNEKGRQVGIVSFPVAVDGPVPIFAGMLEKDKEKDVTAENKLRSKFHNLLHDVSELITLTEDLVKYDPRGDRNIQ